MDPRRVPGTQIAVSPICLGTMTFGRPVARPEAIRLVHLAMDLGVNFIDTANIYEGYDRFLGSAGGVAEEVLGEALAGRRERVVLTTKVGNPVGGGPDDVGLGRTHVLRELEKSLRRMRTDHVDFYLAHRPDPATPLEEMVAMFDSLVTSGKVRHWGFSNFEAAAVREMVRISTSGGFCRPRLSQPRYSLLCRDIELDHLPACREHGIGVAPFRVLESGLLSGKYAAGAKPPEGSRGADMPTWLSADLSGLDVYWRIGAVAEVARVAGITTAQCAIAWALAQAGIIAAVVGVTREEQLKEAVRAAEVRLDSSTLDKLKDLA
jgi:aryl-alcohol dehydrogenase-like predicted oxidoreductase